MSRFTATPRRLAQGLATTLLLLLGAVAACGERADETAGAEDSSPARIDTETGHEPGTRTETRTDTISIEGMSEPLSLRLFRARDDFPLPFGAYVPEDIDPRADPAEATVHFTAEFGGVRNEDAFVHLFVFPAGTDLHEAVAVARGYTAGRTGIPVSRGIDVTEDRPPPDLGWAVESFRFRYQHDGEWYLGTVGVGQRDERHYMIVRHYPAEHADGFAPRADLILETWRWDDGSPLREADEGDGVGG